MSRTDRQALRARRREIRAELARRKAAARAALAQKQHALGVGGKRKQRHQRRLMALLLLILLLALLPDCRCSESEPVAGSPPPPVEGTGEAEAEPSEEPLGGRIRRQDRPEYASVAPAPLPWLDAFRMQVAARSPRLATCFVGADQPGTLRWTTSVEPVTGQVSDHELEPTLLSAPLTRRQKACIIDVLSAPTYQLQADGERATPSRVGMVLEF